MLTIGIYRGDQRSNAHAAFDGDLRQTVPELFFKADAGLVAFNSNRALRRALRGEPVIASNGGADRPRKHRHGRAPSDTRRSRLERGFRVSAFRRRLGEAGYVEHRNVGTDYRWAEGQVDQLPAFARELVRAQVAGDESDSYLKASLRRTYRYRDLRP